MPTMPTTLTPLAPNLWTLSHPLHLGPICMDHVMSVVRLANDQLWIHSPVEYSPALGKALAALGTPAHFIAPSTYHDLYWLQWFAAYPQARFYAVPGVKKEHPELPFSDVLESEPPNAWDESFAQVFVGGMPKTNEIAFLHKESNAAIITDLVFNYEHDEGFNYATRLALKIFGTYKVRCGVSRLLRLFIKDKNAFRRSLDEIIAWDFGPMVVGHGRPIEADGSNALRTAYAFLKA